MRDRIKQIIQNIKELDSNDKNILIFILGILLLIIQKPIEFFSIEISWMVFLLGLLSLFGSILKSYLEDRDNG
jgi:hypothetical protein